MRIITGIAKGKKLYSNKGADIKPTSDRVKETLFNIIGYAIDGSSFLDLFSCTGNIGLEAFSRGADCVTMVDKEEKQKLIHKNIDLCGFAEYRNHKIFLYSLDVLRAVDLIQKKKKKFHWIFLDPPYKKIALYNTLLQRIAETDILHTEGKVIAEHSKRECLSDSYGCLIRERKKHIGDTSLSFYSRKHY